MCDAASPEVPPTIQISPDLQHEVDLMIRHSPTFREQCRLVAAAPLLYVRMYRQPWAGERGFRARSIIERSRSGVLIATVQIGTRGSPVEWIAHEFEHWTRCSSGGRSVATNS
jgi:hypothetical protein